MSQGLLFVCASLSIASARSENIPEEAKIDFDFAFAQQNFTLIRVKTYFTLTLRIYFQSVFVPIVEAFFFLFFFTPALSFLYIFMP